MPLVKCAALFGNHDPYSMKSGDETSNLNPENRGGYVCCDSYSCGGCGNTSFVDSPSDELVNNATGLTILENASHGTYIKNSSACSLLVSKHNSFRFDGETDYLNIQNPISYDDNKMRLKLQELEKALLDDNTAEDDCIIDHYNPMEIDSEWTDAISSPLLDGSPKHTSSSESNITSTSSPQEIPGSIPSSPRGLLFECAALVHSGKFDRATDMINILRERVSIQGDPSDRIAAYLVEALAARMASSGRGLYKALKCKQQPSLDRLSAMQVLFEVCPCFRFGFMTANSAILEACKFEKKIHIVDFDINQGSQYYTLLKTLAEIPGPRAKVKLTGVDDPESVQRPVGGLKIIGQRLEQLAEDLQLSFEFHAVAAETALVSPSMLCCQPDEALVVNFAFQLHHMPDESVSTVNLRDQLLRMVKSLKPKLVTVVEQNMNTNTSPFLPRFAEAYSYYLAVFESLDAALPRDSQDRMNVEKQCLARDIINVIACEGEERIERYEVAGKWRARMSMAGFVSCPISSKVKNEIRGLIQQYSTRYRMDEEMGALHFGWEDKLLVFSSVWR